MRKGYLLYEPEPRKDQSFASLFNELQKALFRHCCGD
jgi:hypothetical protein